MEAMQSFFSAAPTSDPSSPDYYPDSGGGGGSGPTSDPSSPDYYPEAGGPAKSKSWFDDKSLAAITRMATGLSDRNAAVRAGRYNASMMDANAALADQSAADAKARGDIEAQRHMRQVRVMMGDQRAGFAGQGIDLSNGSAVDATSDTARWGAYDSETIRANAAREAWGFSVQGTNYRNNAALMRATTKTKGYSTLMTSGIEAFKIYKG